MDEHEQTRETNHDDDNDNYEDWDNYKDWDEDEDEDDEDDEDDDGEIIGDFATIEEAIEAAIEDAASEDAAYGITTYTDCGYFEIQVEVDPEDADTRPGGDDR